FEFQFFKNCIDSTEVTLLVSVAKIQGSELDVVLSNFRNAVYYRVETNVGLLLRCDCQRVTNRCPHINCGVDENRQRLPLTTLGFFEFIKVISATISSDPISRDCSFNPLLLV